MALKINEKKERVFELTCDCGKIGGTITFPEKHVYKSDAILEEQMKRLYTTTCDDCIGVSATELLITNI